MEENAAEFHQGQTPQRPQLGHQLFYVMDEGPNDLLQHHSAHFQRRQFQGKVAVQPNITHQLLTRPQQDHLIHHRTDLRPSICLQNRYYSKDIDQQELQVRERFNPIIKELIFISL